MEIDNLEAIIDEWVALGHVYTSLEINPCSWSAFWEISEIGEHNWANNTRWLFSDNEVFLLNPLFDGDG